MTPLAAVFRFQLPSQSLSQLPPQLPSQLPVIGCDNTSSVIVVRKDKATYVVCKYYSRILLKILGVVIKLKQGMQQSKVCSHKVDLINDTQTLICCCHRRHHCCCCWCYCLWVFTVTQMVGLGNVTYASAQILAMYYRRCI